MMVRFHYKSMLLAIMVIVALATMCLSLQAQVVPDFAWPQVVERLEKVESRLTTVDDRLGQVESQLGRIDSKMSVLLSEVRAIQRRGDTPVIATSARTGEPEVLYTPGTYTTTTYESIGCGGPMMGSQDSCSMGGDGGILSRFRERRAARRARGGGGLLGGGLLGRGACGS